MLTMASTSHISIQFRNFNSPRFGHLVGCLDCGVNYADLDKPIPWREAHHTSADSYQVE